MSQATIDDLNRRLEEKGARKASVANFRPNLLVTGLEPYGEDRLKIIKVDGHTIFLIGRCPRCSIPTNDPNKGKWEASPPYLLNIDEGAPLRIGELSEVEVSKTIMSYRRVDPGEKYAACMGMHGTAQDFGYYINVGDVITIVETTSSHDRRGTDVHPDFWAS